MPNRTISLALFGFIALSLGTVAGTDEPDLPAVFTPCTTPQIIGNPVPIAPVPAHTLPPRWVWNGSLYATVIGTGTQLQFTRHYADGSSAGAPVTIHTGSVHPNEAPVVAFSGSQYGVAWLTGDATPKLYFAILGLNGAPIYGPFEIRAEYANEKRELALAQRNGTFALVYTYLFTGADYDLYGELFSYAGGHLNFAGPILVNTAGAKQQEPAISAGESGFVVAWSDSNTGDGRFALRFRTLGMSGTLGTILWIAITPGVDYWAPAIRFGATQHFVLASTSNGELVRFAIYNDGSSSGGTVLSSNVLARGLYSVVWTGSEFLAIWFEGLWGGSNYAQRFDDYGSAKGGAALLGVGGTAYYLTPTWGIRGLLLNCPGYGRFITPAGCAAITQPPTCAGNYLAYSITGSTASISWTPAQDFATDIAYYQVFRNNQPIAKTAATYYNDSGLAPGTVYNYLVQPVNAAGLQNGACTASIYVNTSAALLLTVSKSAPHAALAWTDAGLNNYNIFRGTDPRAFSLIGATPANSSQDPNALTGSVSYFYSVDNPGP